MLKIGPRCFPSFPSSNSVLVCFKSQRVSIGAKIVFSANCQDVKNEVSEKKFIIFCFCLFYVGERQTEKKKNTKRKNATNAQKNCVLGVVMKNEKGRKMNYTKLAKHYLCFEGRKTVLWCTLSVSAKFFGGPKTAQTRKHYKNSGFRGNCLPN